MGKSKDYEAKAEIVPAKPSYANVSASLNFKKGITAVLLVLLIWNKVTVSFKEPLREQSTAIKDYNFAFAPEDVYETPLYVANQLKSCITGNNCTDVIGLLKNGSTPHTDGATATESYFRLEDDMCKSVIHKKGTYMVVKCNLKTKSILMYRSFHAGNHNLDSIAYGWKVLEKSDGKPIGKDFAGIGQSAAIESFLKANTSIVTTDCTKGFVMDGCRLDVATERYCDVLDQAWEKQTQGKFGAPFKYYCEVDARVFLILPYYSTNYNYQHTESSTSYYHYAELGHLAQTFQMKGVSNVQYVPQGIQLGVEIQIALALIIYGGYLSNLNGESPNVFEVISRLGMGGILCLQMLYSVYCESQYMETIFLSDAFTTHFFFAMLLPFCIKLYIAFRMLCTSAKHFVTPGQRIVKFSKFYGLLSSLTVVTYAGVMLLLRNEQFLYAGLVTKIRDYCPEGKGSCGDPYYPPIAVIFFAMVTLFVLLSTYLTIPKQPIVEKVDPAISSSASLAIRTKFETHCLGCNAVVISPDIENYKQEKQVRYSTQFSILWNGFFGLKHFGLFGAKDLPLLLVVYVLPLKILQDLRLSLILWDVNEDENRLRASRRMYLGILYEELVTANGGSLPALKAQIGDLK